MAINKIILFGNLVRDPEFRQTAAGTPFCRFTVACSRQFANKETGEREADFIECTAWRNTAEFVSRYFSKGSPITVEGSLRNNNYTDNNGVKHYSYNVMAEQVGFAGRKTDDNQGGNYDGAPKFGTVEPPKNNPLIPKEISAQDLDEFEEIISDGEIPF